MPSRTGLSVPASFFRIDEKTRGEPFSPSDVESVLGKGVRTRLELSRLVRLGWLFRLSRGRYATVDPIVRLTPGLDEGISRFRLKCFYPVLQRAVGGIVRLYGPRLQGIALFGSMARGKFRPGSDVDLFVLLDRHEEEVETEVRESTTVSKTVQPLAGEEPRGHFHDASPVVADARAFRTPGHVMLGVVSDAIVLYDPQGKVAAGLRRLRRLLREAKAKEYRTESGRPYWFTGTLYGEAIA